MTGQTTVSATEVDPLDVQADLCVLLLMGHASRWTTVTYATFAQQHAVTGANLSEVLIRMCERYSGTPVVNLYAPVTADNTGDVSEPRREVAVQHGALPDPEAAREAVFTWLSGFDVKERW